MRLVLADLAQPLVPHLAAGRRVACGRGGDEPLACLGRGDEIDLGLRLVEPLDHGFDHGDPQRLTSSLLLACGYTDGSSEKLSATKTREADLAH
jgi:hypothetical protein